MGSLGLPELLMMFGFFVGGTALIITLVYLIARKSGRMESSGQRFCNKCGAKNANQQRFCGSCGVRLPDLMSYESSRMELGDVFHRDSQNEMVTNRLEGPPSIAERTTELLEAAPEKHSWEESNQ